MAERVDGLQNRADIEPRDVTGGLGTVEGRGVNDDRGVNERHDAIENADGSSARASTADGHLDASDITHSPFLEGTDPLSDEAIERRRPAGTPMTPQLVIFGILTVFFAYFFISDVVHGSWGKAALGALVLAVCGFAIVREVRGKH